MPAPKVLVLIGLLTVLVLVLGVRFFQNRSLMTMNSNGAIADHQQVTAQLGQRVITLEVVNTPASITRGLSGRSQIGSDGMLFILGAPRYPNFWMKEMLFDLDLVWLLDNQVIEITRNVPRPQPGVSESHLPTYSPQSPVNQVLEIPAGTAETWGLVVGDQLEIR